MTTAQVGDWTLRLASVLERARDATEVAANRARDATETLLHAPAAPTAARCSTYELSCMEGGTPPLSESEMSDNARDTLARLGLSVSNAVNEFVTNLSEDSPLPTTTKYSGSTR
uniref:Uncharacterized protein n=1 Tax=Prymnesium polylepis TaxID=72548 RepID=A0A6T7ZY66_9EUKA|mmetsp:Transcript_48970/g.135839  ORF Transcript_48970/g.135839 Transcript_48970/m.135839 type:complete len:114 (-) Transcript_48970:107-448(-)